MPIKCKFQANPISESDFYSLDYEVMAIAFSIHNDMGRFWGEEIYQNELAYRCQKAGFNNVATEVPIQLSFNDFEKYFYIDLLINSAVYEIKTAQALSGEHQKQTINYLLLTGLNHGKLINMRPQSVQHRFVSTKITREKRYDFTIDDRQWREFDEDSIWLKQMFTSLLNEWGAFLTIDLFYEAIEHFRGGKEMVIKEIDGMDGSRSPGKQKAHLLNSEIALKISSVTKMKDEEYYELHLHRFIQYTSLKAVHWINFNHDTIVFKTIIK